MTSALGIVFRTPTMWAKSARNSPQPWSQRFVSHKIEYLLRRSQRAHTSLVGALELDVRLDVDTIGVSSTFILPDTRCRPFATEPREAEGSIEVIVPDGEAPVGSLVRLRVHKGEKWRAGSITNFDPLSPRSVYISNVRYEISQVLYGQIVR